MTKETEKQNIEGDNFSLVNGWISEASAGPSYSGGVSLFYLYLEN